MQYLVSIIREYVFESAESFASFVKQSKAETFSVGIDTCYYMTKEYTFSPRWIVNFQRCFIHKSRVCPFNGCVFWIVTSDFRKSLASGTTMLECFQKLLKIYSVTICRKTVNFVKISDASAINFL